MLWPFLLHPKAPGDPGGGKGSSDHIQTHKEKEMNLLEADKNPLSWTETAAATRERVKMSTKSRQGQEGRSWPRFCPSPGLAEGLSTARGAAERSRSSCGGLTFHAGCHVPEGITSFLQAHQELFSRLDLFNNFIIDLGMGNRNGEMLNMQRLEFYILTNSSNFSG